MKEQRVSRGLLPACSLGTWLAPCCQGPGLTRSFHKHRLSTCHRPVLCLTLRSSDDAKGLILAPRDVSNRRHQQPAAASLSGNLEDARGLEINSPDRPSNRRLKPRTDIVAQGHMLIKYRSGPQDLSMPLGDPRSPSDPGTEVSVLPELGGHRQVLGEPG